MDRELEIWSDSFHEGRWLLTEIGSRLHTFEIHFERGFLPVASLDFGSGRLTVRVFGDYNAWKPVPPPVKSALKFGKPDFVLYSREEDRVLFVGEETAAVPTGNQSTQRCERMVGACLQEPPIPFVYLLPDYGLHKDGNLRRTSVWPVFLAAKLTDQYRTESLVLTFGDKQHPEDYDIGDGPGLLFELVVSILKEYMGLSTSEWQTDRQRIVDRAKADMKRFATEHAPTMLDVLPKYCTSSSGDLS